MANQNQLTSSGLTVGNGTMTKFLSTISGIAIGVGSVTKSRPSRTATWPSSFPVGSIQTYYGNDSDSEHYLPSSGQYIYVEDYDAYDDRLATTLSLTHLSKFGGGGSRIGGNLYCCAVALRIS